MLERANRLKLRLTNGDGRKKTFKIAGAKSEVSLANLIK